MLDAAATAVLVSFDFTFQMRGAQIDGVETFWITLAMYGLLRHLLLGPAWRWYAIGFLAAGMGVITKGVGVLALLLFVPYLFARWRGWAGVTRTAGDGWRWLGGVLAFAAPVLAWGGAVLLAAQAHGTPEYAAYVDDLFFRQTATRYAHSWHHAQPFWYFVPVVLFGWLPLSLGYLGAAPRWWRDLRAGEARVLLPLAWALLVAVFFSIPSGKREVYLMPAMPMVALAMAPYLADIVQARWLRLTAFVLALGGGLAIAALGAWAWFGHSAAVQRFVEQRELGDAGHLLWALVLAIGLAFVACALAFRPRRGVHALLGGFAATWLIVSLGLYPLLNDSSSARGLMRKARELAGTNTELGLVAWKEQNLLMLEGPRAEFGFLQPWPEQYARAVQWLAADPAQRWVFIRAAAMGTCVDRRQAHFIGHANRRDWWMFQLPAVTPGCVPRVATPAAADDEG